MLDNGLMITLISQSHVPFSDFIVRNLKLANVSYVKRFQTRVLRTHTGALYISYCYSIKLIP